VIACPQCGFAENRESAFTCDHCGVPLVLLADGRFVVDEFVAEAGPVQYYDVHEVEDSNRCYTLAVCSKAVADPLEDVGFEFGLEKLSQNGLNPFRTEFELLSRFNSPGILRAVHCFADGKLAYLVLERIEGRRLTEIKQLSEAEVRQIGIQLCQIADSFHRQRLVHNGFEPNGLIVDSQGRLKLIHFERVRPAKLYNMSVPIHITEGFSAPELYLLDDSSVLDKRSDIYSIGAILYWLLTGETIPTANMAVIRASRWEIYPRAVVSPAFERIVMRALAFEPLDRYNSVNELKFALANLSAPVSVQLGYATDVGRHRELNEDSILALDLRQCFESVNTHIGLYVASDGMGGEAAGEVASRISVRAVAERVTERLISASLRSTHGGQVAEPTQTGSILLANDTGIDVRASQLLIDAIRNANDQVLDYAQYHPNTRGLGATLTAALLVGNVLTVGHVGDSRCYVLSDGRFEQLTEDHSLVERMIQRGELTRDESRFHPHRNIIYRSIGSREEMEIDIVTRMLSRGDLVLLCSDGLTGMLDDEEVAAIMGHSEDPWYIAKELVVAANSRGGEDNISVIVIRIE
jgi:serine/threonine protein phosphatase PrpC